MKFVLNRTDPDERIRYIYRPGRRYLALLPLMLFFCIAGFVAVGSVLFSQEQEGKWFAVLFLSVYGIFTGAAVKLFYDLSRVFLCCTEEGLFILGDSKVAMTFVPWTDISHIYESLDYKGHRYLIISGKSLNSKQLKKMTVQANWLSKLYVDDAVVIWCPSGKYADGFLKEVKSHISQKHHC